jgi:hypothetical protein
MWKLEPKCGAGLVRVSLAGKLAGPRPGDPASATLGTLGPESLRGRGGGPAQGVPRRCFLASLRPGHEVPTAGSAVGSQGTRAPRRLPLSERHCPPRSPRSSGLVPPTCSRLLTSRAAGTMGWGCHSNQTGRHNPGMCAAPPPPAVQPALPPPPSAGCGTRAAGRGGRSGPGFAGAG